jgi:hypothetical protein
MKLTHHDVSMAFEGALHDLDRLVVAAAHADSYEFVDAEKPIVGLIMQRAQLLCSILLARKVPEFYRR